MHLDGVSGFGMFGASARRDDMIDQARVGGFRVARWIGYLSGHARSLRFGGRIGCRLGRRRRLRWRGYIC